MKGKYNLSDGSLLLTKVFRTSPYNYMGIKSTSLKLSDNRQTESQAKHHSNYELAQRCAADPNNSRRPLVRPLEQVAGILQPGPEGYKPTPLFRHNLLEELQGS